MIALCVTQAVLKVKAKVIFAGTFPFSQHNLDARYLECHQIQSTEQYSVETIL